MPSKARIIFLNGISSSGKSSLAHALQQILEEPYPHANADAVKEMSAGIPPAEWGTAFERGAFMPRLYAAIPACFATLASFGNHLIIDDVVRPLQLRNYVEALSAYEVWFVGVHCSLEELERRETERGNRRLGTARRQMEQGLVHTPGIYDLEVDTSLHTPETCALQIKQRLQTGIAPDAFQRLAQIPVETLWYLTDGIDQSIYAAAHPEKYDDCDGAADR